MNDKDKETERLARIETNVAHLEHQLEQLNQVVIEQGRELAKLRQTQLQMADYVESAEMERIRANTTKPPHYSP